MALWVIGNHRECKESDRVIVGGAQPLVTVLHIVEVEAPLLNKP